MNRDHACSSMAGSRAGSGTADSAASSSVASSSNSSDRATNRNGGGRASAFMFDSSVGPSVIGSLHRLIGSDDGRGGARAGEGAIAPRPGVPGDRPEDAARRARLAFQGRRGGEGVNETTKMQPKEDL